MTGHIRAQALLAIDEADIILFLMDGRQGLTPSDQEIADILRRTEKKVFFIVNKIDGPELEIELLSPFYALGVDALWPLSADHGYGFQTLMDALTADLKQVEDTDELPEGTMRLAFFGRPNVGSPP